jgi:NADPH-dependent curcumin reductase CurA
MNRQIVVAELPSGRVEARHFRAVDAAMPAVGSGEVLCRTLFASLDPVNRALMRGRTYRDGLDVGDVMPAFTVSALVTARSWRVRAAGRSMRRCRPRRSCPCLFAGRSAIT